MNENLENRINENFINQIKDFIMKIITSGLTRDTDIEYGKIDDIESFSLYYNKSVYRFIYELNSTLLKLYHFQMKIEIFHASFLIFQDAGSRLTFNFRIKKKVF